MRPPSQTPRSSPTFLRSPRRSATAASTSRPIPPPRVIHWQPLPLSPLSLLRLLLRRRILAPRSSKPYSSSLASAAIPENPCSGAMARVHDDGGEGREAAKALRRGKHRRVVRETMSREEDRKKKRRRKSDKAPPTSQASSSQPAPCQEHRTASIDDDSSAEVNAMVTKRLREMLAVDAAQKKIIAEIFQSFSEEHTLTVENTFGDSDDGSFESLEARKVALLVSQSIVSLSSFAGGKRIRVCSGFVMYWNDCTNTSMILTAATLVRSLNGDNNVIPDLMVKVLLPDGNITDGHIFLVDFHYNMVAVEVTAGLKHLEVAHVKDITDKGGVLALGRAYEDGDLMCSRGQVVNQTSIFWCSELLVSSCKISMAGVGGPLVNYDGHVLGINFYEKDQTSYLSMLIVSRILEQHQHFGKIIRPWLGLRYPSLQTVPLRVLERIYQKFPDVDKGLYISDVAEGSPADVAGLCVGDVLVKCGEKVLSTAPEFGAMLLDACKEHVETHGEIDGDCAGKNITVEVVIKKQRDGSTIFKSIAADVMNEFHYNTWPAPMPIYKPRIMMSRHIRGAPVGSYGYPELS